MSSPVFVFVQYSPLPPSLAGVRLQPHQTRRLWISTVHPQQCHNMTGLYVFRFGFDKADETALRGKETLFYYVIVRVFWMWFWSTVSVLPVADIISSIPVWRSRSPTLKKRYIFKCTLTFLALYVAVKLTFYLVLQLAKFLRCTKGEGGLMTTYCKSARNGYMGLYFLFLIRAGCFSTQEESWWPSNAGKTGKTPPRDDVTYIIFRM